MSWGIYAGPSDYYTNTILKNETPCKMDRWTRKKTRL